MRRLDRELTRLLTDDPTADRATLAEAVRQAEPLIDASALHDVVDRAWQRANGLGPIAALLQEPGTTELMINGPGPVWLDRAGHIEATDLLVDATDIGLLIERILDPLGLRVDRVSPMVDARLADGSRVNIVVPPLAIDGPIVTIRRFSGVPVPVAAFGPPEMTTLVTTLVSQRRSIVVSGGTGTGKTTFLNALGELLDPDERVVVIEDTSELQFPGRHIVRMEARPPNSEGVGAVGIRDLVRNALRMRPDRLVVGEVRGAEALDLLFALNTGHEGSLSTCHANSPAAAVDRLAHLSLLGDVGMPLDVLEEQVRSGVDVIVQVERSGRQRRVREIVEVRPTGPTAVRSLWKVAA